MSTTFSELFFTISIDSDELIVQLSIAMKTNLKRLEGEQSFRDYVRGLCIETSHSAVASKYGLSLSHLSNIIHGYGTVGPTIAQRFGYEKLRTFAFVPIRKA